jgi:hypothetical protein
VKQKLITMLLVVATLVVATLSAVTTTAPPALAANGPGTRWPIDDYGPNEQSDNIILKWDERLLETIRAVPPRTTGPVVTARAIGVLHTATYDAWAAYDESAVGTRLLGDLRQPPSQRTGQLGLDNKKKAISYAAYRVLVDLFPSRASVFSGYMESPVAEGGLGYSPISASTNTTTPEGVGNVAAEAVLQFRRGDPNVSTDGDGSNQQLDPAGTGAVVYPSNVPYTYVNTWQTVTDRWQWQPLCVPLVPYGTPCSPSAEQKALAPHWKNVASFALNSTTHYPPQFKLPGPPKLSNGTCCDPKDVDAALSQTSNLTDAQKTKAEYWADGPGSEFPPGHMAVFAQALSRMRKGTLDQTAWLDRDVKLFFALGNALMDASISAWQAKYEYNFVRPITAIRERYKGKMITSWRGPGQGYGQVLGENWMPYQALNVVTPGFPEYVSGHSTFSGAGGVVLALAFGNNGAFNAKVTIPAGSSNIESGTPAKPVVLSWKTLDTASDEAGWSRRWGGIHFQTGDEHGRGLGKTLGYNVWTKAQLYFNGDPNATTT